MHMESALLAWGMGYQFIHLDGYARHGSQQTKKLKNGTIETSRKWSAQEIAAEAMRDIDACPHVADPKPPVRLYGCSPREAVQQAEAWADEATDGKGRKLRKDGLCLAAGVISLPAEMEADWPRFREAALQWLKKQYGVRLLSVVEHTDEAHPHLHFYAVPLKGERFEVLHKGRSAAAKKASEGAKKGAQNAAYREAMREWQDEFSNAVALDFGLSRLGPKRRRLTRGQWKSEKVQAKALAAVAMPKGMGLRASEVDKLVLEEGGMFKKPVLESDEQQAKRLNSLFAQRVQPLVNAAKQAQAATKREQELAAEVEQLRAVAGLFSEAEIRAARARRDAELADKRKQQQRVQELVEKVAKNLQSADPALSPKEALARSNWLIDNDHSSFEAWLRYEPLRGAMPPPEPAPPPVPKRERINRSGLDFGR